MDKKPTKNSNANLVGLHDLRTLGSMGLRSIPSSPKSAFLDLFMNQTKKERLGREMENLRKKAGQISQRLSWINKRMARLLKIATRRENEADADYEQEYKKEKGKKGRIELEY